MAGQVFTVLYTHQKTKKSKVWQDGILKLLTEGNQAVLYSDKGQRLESVFLKTSEVTPGDDLESDRFLITVETVGESSNGSQSSTEAKDVPKFNRNGLKSVGLRPPAGLKRKFTGFQGPREITKKPSLGVEEPATTSSAQLTQGHSSLPAQLYATSPLFATPYRREADSTQPPDLCSDKIVTWRHTDINGANLSGNLSVSPKQTNERKHVDIPVEGGEIKQSIRSTAQILALLKSQPSRIDSFTNRDEQLSEEPLVKCNSEVLRSMSSVCALEREKPWQSPHTLSPIKPVATKSRWEVYLDQPPASTTGYSDNNDPFVLSSSPNKRLTSVPVGIQDFGAKQEEIISQDMRNTTTDNLSIEDEKSGVLAYVSQADKLSNKRLSNMDLHSYDVSCKSGLSHRQSPTPETFASSHNTVEVNNDDLIIDNEKDDELFSEVTFNLMDSFDFTELDDDGPTVDQPPPESVPAMTKECVDLAEENNMLERKDQETSAENVFLFNTDGRKSTNGLKEINCNDCIASAVSDDSCGKVEGVQTLPNVRCMDKSSDCYSKSEGGSESACKETVENCLPLFKNRTLFFPYKDEESHISSCQSVLQSVDHSKQEATPSNDDDICRYINSKSSPKLPVTNIQHTVKGIWHNEMDVDSPEQACSGISISLLRSLTKPNSALESLNELKVNSPSTAKKRHHDGMTYMERGADEALHRISHSVIQPAEGYQGEPSFTAEPIYPPVSHTDTMQASCSPPTGSPRLACAITAQEKTYFNDYSQIVSEHSPSLHNSNSLTPIECQLPRCIVGTPGSDSDWELPEWSPRDNNKLKTPIQQELPSLDRPFFLRPRYDNVLENSGALLNDFTSFPEQPNFLNTNKIFKVRSRLQKQVPLVTAPKIDVCSNSKPVDDVHSETLKHSNLLLGNASCSTVTTYSSMISDINESKDDLFLQARGRGPIILKPQENVVTSVNMQPSRWSKYQNVSPRGSQNRDRNTDNDFCAQSVFRNLDGLKEIQNNDMEPAVSSHVGHLKDRLGYQNGKDAGSRLQLVTKLLAPAEGCLPVLERKRIHSSDTENEQILLSCELLFPCRQVVLSLSIPKRKVNIPAVFKSPAHYKQIFSASLTEHLNIIMLELSQRLHKAFSKVDMSFYTSSSSDETPRNNKTAPLCLHQQPAKLVMVRKEGSNKGRFFYTCDAPKADQCKFFKWLDDVKGTHPERVKAESRVVMGDMKSLSSYVRCQKINLYEECQLIIRKMSALPKRQFGKFTKVVNADSEFCGVSKTKLYLKLSRKDNSSAYSKDDLWVVSKTLNFDSLDTFIACSVFFGPSSNNDIEISPLNGYFPSNWPSNMIVHALLVCNASTELTCLRNIQEHFNPSTLPLTPHLLTMSSETEKPNKISRGKFIPPAITAKVSYKCEIPDYKFVLSLAMEMIKQFCLNEDQEKSLLKIAYMMAGCDGLQRQQPAPITVIHGVFGSGKSYLLAVVVLFLVQLFESHDPDKDTGSSHWKLLISSSTNVAVDRVLLGLLDLGFDQFIRVGSIRKIAKPILPHSLHAGSDNESEQLKELLALLKGDLTPAEKAYVRKSIELHKLGTNKTLLGQVRVVGATCAACPFACLSNLKFPIVVLDECSQMTEPASLLPIARFQCEKLILVGDPKQLSPTIQGSEYAHEYGLEQTLFNRLCLMGHQVVMLRTQYRCHPTISAVANELFYEGYLLNGVSDEDRKPVLDWLPTLCFYNASGTEQVQGNNSFHNVEEASFTVKLIQSLIVSGIQGSMIGVITLYKAQMNKISCMLSCAAQCDSVEVRAVQVSTVDAFQGAEKEIIILSCVRTRQVGFIDSEKRMNVALTRGKRHLLIVGSLSCLRKNKLWEQVIHHCERQKNGLKHVSQCDEKLNSILKLYQEKKEEEASSIQKNLLKAKVGKIFKPPAPDTWRSF
ncbi:5'-3' DNA helicase ZGRF1 isoform X3 [Mixophyes fleayi]|uniref:5'-3' DNA helicase ZGRF1 isoform X3 n=1 Tax=Mixophyes fleayi TaxID=3061075 RepID=UPI003F4E3C9E